MGTKPHVLAIPFPAQGHVIPMMEFAKKLVHHGIKVSFVNTDFIHNQIINALPGNHDGDIGDGLQLVSVPAGLELWERMDSGKLTDAMERVMAVEVEKLITEKMESEDNKITCVVAEGATGWALEVAKKIGIKGIAFYPASATTLALFSSIQELIDSGIIDNDGAALKKELIHLSPAMPAMDPAIFSWACFADAQTRKSCFELLVNANKFLKKQDLIICNSDYELEPAAFSSLPKTLPVGPLLASNRLGNQSGNFWPEDSACLSWLDQQPPCSVIYVAFGSFTVFDKIQFQELALGLELTNKPFLWVVRPGMNKDMGEAAYPEGFEKRIASRGRMVGWAPQVKVLRHPAVACFLSHCGWNSTIEGLSNGVPFLSWPYICDQFLNESYICDVWKVGLGLEKDETCIVRRGEITKKVAQLLGDKDCKERVMDLKEKIMKSVQQERSYKNLSHVIECIKDISNY